MQKYIPGDFEINEENLIAKGTYGKIYEARLVNKDEEEDGKRYVGKIIDGDDQKEKEF